MACKPKCNLERGIPELLRKYAENRDFGEMSLDIMWRKGGLLPSVVHNSAAAAYWTFLVASKSVFGHGGLC